MARIVPLTERVRIYFPERLDGSGLAALECSEGTAQYFKLHDLPPARDPEYVTPGSIPGWYFITCPPNKLSVKRYRIAYGDPWPTGKQRSASFGLGKRHSKQALEIICRHLDAVGADWLWLCNEHGNRGTLSCFHSRAFAA